ncbi:MAG: RDD family protein [Haloechinothrix sp.]
MSKLVTGEAVALDLQLAKLASRSVAAAIDVALQVLALGALYAVLLLGPGLDNALAAAVGLVVSVAVLVGYPVLAETLSRGRTLGKLAMGLRVVRDDGGPISFRHALVRGLAWFFVDFWALGVFGFVAMVVSLSSVKGKRVGDLLAGTVVIRERVPGSRTDLISMPPQLSGWAADLDLAGLPDGLALTMRQFLGRFDQLDPGAREDLGRRLVAEVREHIGTPPPAGTPTWAYLAAVLAERRAREGSGPNGWAERPVHRLTPGDRQLRERQQPPVAPRSDSPFTPPG